MSLDPSSMLAVAVGGLLLIASATDIARLRIPNWISAAVLAAFALFVAVAHVSLSVFLLHLAAGLTVLAFGIAMFAWGKLGGGDVKLLSAVSFCVGWAPLFQFLFAVSLFGALVSLIVVVLRIRSIADTIHSKGHRLVVLEAEAGAPYAIAIAGGFFFLLLTPIH